MKTNSDLLRIARFFAMALLAAPVTASAADFSLKLEPGVTLPMTAPQSDRFGMGGAVSLKGLVELGHYLDLSAGITFLGQSANSDLPSQTWGSAWAPGLGLRLRFNRETTAWRLANPYAQPDENGISPWVDGDAMYVRTGPLDRFAYAGAVGVAFPLGEERSWYLGPFLRYMQIVQLDKIGFDAGDSLTLILGVSLEAGTSLVRPSPPVEPPPRVVCAECPPVDRRVAIIPPRDRDLDIVPDEWDLCPTVAGLRETGGCPAYEYCIVRPDKLELKEKIQFAFNEAVIEPASFPALDEVAQALADNKEFRVQVEGHASAEGGEEHNQTLSEGRAAAVLDYLAKHGVPRDRLVSKGFSSSRPVGTNVTTAGREANRRVEFVVSFIILKEDGSVQ